MKKKIASQLIATLLCLLPLIGMAQPIDLPDLIISNLEVIDPINPNYDISYQFDITNVGDEAASLDDVGVQAFVSKDQIFSPNDDIAAGGTLLNTSVLASGETITRTFGATVSFSPTSTPYLVMKVDWQDALPEEDEGNNFAWANILEPQEVPLTSEVVNSQLMIQYSQLTDIQITEIQAILIRFGGVIIDECNCDRSIAVWQFGSAEQAQAAAEAIDTYSATKNLDEEVEADGNELVRIELERPRVGFELKSSEQLPKPRRDVLIYLIDSGVNTKNLPKQERGHLLRPAPILCGSIKSVGFNYQFPPNVTKDFNDENGHGTFGYRAITKDVPDNIKVVPLKIFDEKGRGTLFSMICAIYHAIDNGGDIVNISAGYQGDKNSILEDAIEEARNAGIFIIAAAGNDKTNIDKKPYYPASFASTYKNVISVASQNSATGRLGKCSNYGQKSVTLSAPGEKICGYDHNGNKVILSGTSMAAFYVTRQLAIEMVAKNPGSINIGNVLNVFLNQQKSNCLQDKTISGKCLNISSNVCF